MTSGKAVAIPSIAPRPPKPTKVLAPAVGCNKSPYKSEFDHREYKYVVLDNGIKCMLIYDPNSDKSAASAEF